MQNRMRLSCLSAHYPTFGMDKPIIGIRPWGQERVPIKIQENADIMIGWNSAPLVQAVRDHAI